VAGTLLSRFIKLQKGYWTQRRISLASVHPVSLNCHSEHFHRICGRGVRLFSTMSPWTVRGSARATRPELVDGSSRRLSKPNCSGWRSSHSKSSDRVAWDKISVESPSFTLPSSGLKVGWKPAFPPGKMIGWTKGCLSSFAGITVIRQDGCTVAMVLIT
jgi:hypothetical protein